MQRKTFAFIGNATDAADATGQNAKIKAVSIIDVTVMRSRYALTTSVVLLFALLSVR